MSADDFDLLNNQRLTFTLDGALKDHQHFAIEQVDERHALIVLLKAPDFEENRIFEFYLRATDAGTPSLYGR